jgi:membrane-associated HD superfamily phosphohydrolase
MLAFPISLVLLQFELMLMVYLLRLFILALMLLSIRTDLFMLVSFCESLEYMLNIVHAVGTRWLSVDLFLLGRCCSVSHHTTLTWLCLSQIFPVLAYFLMFKESVEVDKDVTGVVLAIVDGFSAAVLASGEMELELSIVKLLVVAIEGADEHFARAIAGPC